MKLKTIIFTFCFLALSCSKPKVYTDADIQIIPKPVSIEIKSGIFEFDEDTKFVVSNNEQTKMVNIFVGRLKKSTGWTIEIVETAPQKNYVQFVEDVNFNQEAYGLSVTSNYITITASSEAGYLYGLESIRQLLPLELENSNVTTEVDWVVPNLEIKDEPRFKYRGLMLDLSRHFFDKNYIKKTIDRLAMHKMNVLHLHLVDDQGWRIEIKKYPKLTEIGSWRVDQEDKHWNAREAVSSDEKGTYGGFLTQEDLKEIVKYAQSKNVDVIPEIEMPAHVTSAIASYPHLSCFENHIAVPSGGIWPLTDIYCAGKESTFEFLENVLLEVMDIFPSKYIHIGGDEATKTNWKKCPHCQKRIKEEGLNNVEELQSYFVKRMERFINSHGKKLIGWDEILEGGLAPDATVMSWRGVKGGIEAAEQGHDVIMTPGTHCYFDHYQGPQNHEPLAIGGFTPLSKVYQFDPVVETMNEEEASHVLGGQANLWAEYIPTESHSEYMIFPRLAALSETLWSPKETRNWEDFSKRVQTMFKRYEMMGINYAKSSYMVTADTEIDIENQNVNLTLQNEYTNADIRYVIGNEDLNSEATKYSSPINLKETTIVKVSLFNDNKPIGNTLVDTIKFHKGVAKKVKYLTSYSDRYSGSGEFNMTNTLRGTKNFHDGKWQAWLNRDMELIIDLDTPQAIHQVKVGSMENQGPSIFFPTAVIVSISNDGETYQEVGRIERDFAMNSDIELKDFTIDFEEQEVRFIKVKAINLKDTPKGGGSWLFVDEILID